MLTNEEIKVPIFAKFVMGGMAGVIAQTMTHPMDVVKIRMQVSSRSFCKTIVQTFHDKGVRGFYTGLTAAILRQVTYTTARLGIYYTLLDFADQHFGRLNYATMISFGMVSGIVGSFIGTPADLILVRMVAGITSSPEKQKHYRNAITGIIHVWKSEGFFALWRGAVPTMGRAAVINGTQLGTYTRTKMLLQDTGWFRDDTLLLQSIAAMMSGIATCLTSIPLDVAKTRIQSKRDPTESTNLISTMLNLAKKEGILSLWRGFFPYYFRAAPNTMITMVCVDQFQRMYLEFFAAS